MIATARRYACSFPVKSCHGSESAIKVTYWINELGQVGGEAYFKADDFCAEISNGEFAHPYSGLRYKLHVPSRFGKSPYAILDVLRWSNVGNSVPVEA